VVLIGDFGAVVVFVLLVLWIEEMGIQILGSLINIRIIIINMVKN
jgi:hypothetical protein